MKKLFAIVLCICIVLCTTACTGSSLNNNTEITLNNDAATTSPQSAPETKTIYLPLSSTIYSSSEKLEVVANTEYKYDENNFLTEIISYRRGEVSSQCFVTCDAFGNVIYTRELSYFSVGDVEMVYRYTRDAYGNILKEEMVDNGQVLSTITYTYDAVGNMATKDMGNLRYEYSYNADGQVTGYVGYEDGVQKESMEISFDAQGRPIKRTRYNEEGIAGSFVEYTYEANTIVATHLDSVTDHFPAYHRYTYDKNGNEIQHDRWGGMSSQTSTEYTYLALEVPVDSIRQPYKA